MELFEALRRLDAEIEAADAERKRLANSTAKLRERIARDEIRLKEAELQLKKERKKEKSLEKRLAKCRQNLKGKPVFVTEQADIDLLATEGLTLHVQILADRQEILESARKNGFQCDLISPPANPL